MTLSHSSIFTESRSRSTASISLQSSPNHSLTKSMASAQSLRPYSFSLSLSLISISYLSLLVSNTDSTLKSQTFSLSLSLSLSLSQILKSKAWNLFTKSSSLTQTLSLSNLCSPPVPYSLHQFHTKSQIFIISIFISLQSSLFKSFDLRSSHRWTDHTLKNSVLTLPLSTPRSKP